MNIQPYLFFNGRCDEALAFYRKTLGAEQTLLMRFKDSPDAPPMPLPPGWADKVMHAELNIGATVLMASDGCGAADALEFKGFSLSIDMPDAATARRAFDALAEGGTVQMPLDKTFFAPCFGMLTDRFGVSWMLIVNEQVQ
jgi:PhnB protein